MQLQTILPVLGLLLMFFSSASLPPAIVALLYNEPEISLFIFTFLSTLLIGWFLWFPFRHEQVEMGNRDGFIVTVLFWLVLGIVGAMPFLMMEAPALSWTDAFFESLSGLTTTGATILSHIESLPRSILFYRQQLQWLGGMGIIVLAVAVLPMLGIGGMQLYRTEAPGPVKDRKLTPRIKETAKALWYIYVGLTVICALGYWLAGMNVFDAISHSFSTVAIGGFSTHDASMAYFDSPWIDGLTTFFMLIAGINFSLHFLVLRDRSLTHYWYDSEVRCYLFILALVSVVVVSALYWLEVYDLGDALHYGLFEVVSIATTTGYTSSGFSAWPLFLPFLLFLTSFAGGCAGSTAGGMKVIRILLIFKQGMREVYRLVHPNGVFVIKFGGHAISEKVGEAVWGFFSAYVFLFIIMFLLMMALGLDLTTAFSTVASCMNNLGPALGAAADNYQALPDIAKWILCFAMLLGRLEIFTLLVLLTPMFWRY
ncbi:Trk system potassium uptake protein TrkH [invertebrate metagenome]|uniref:Trk system potassium uptake protein TrkH n=1 Tax=invertebrate metagenome TaxID=1711999 RepID=A0A2H9T876_9ZZZZ